MTRNTSKKTNKNKKVLQKNTDLVKGAKVDDAILGSYENSRISRVLDSETTTLEPEQKYVRRTAKEFKAGADPVVGRGSHRLVEQKLSFTPELLAAAKDAAEKAGVPLTMWARAAFRKALRDSMDVNFELETAVTIPVQPNEPE